MVREDEPPQPSTKLSTADALPSIAANRDTEPKKLTRAVAGRTRLDRDEGAGEGPHPAVRDGQRVRRRHPAVPGRRAGAGRPAEPGLPAAEVRAAAPGAVLAASLVLLALLAGIAGTTWGLIRAENRRVEASEPSTAEASVSAERDDALKKEAERVKERDWPSRPRTTAPTNSSTASASATWSWPVAAYDNRDVKLAAERLDNVPPDQRGWEWRYLKQQSRGGLFTLYGHRDGLSSASFSPDGSRIVTGSWDQTAKVWDARTGTALLELKGHTGAVNSVSFSPDGSRILTGSDDGTAKVWDARTGKRLARTQRAHRRCEQRVVQPRRLAHRHRQAGTGR